MTVTEQELTATLARMETKLAGQNDPEVRRLFQHYRNLCATFAADLDQQRDLLLAKTGALMLVQRVALSQGQADTAVE